MYTVGPCYFGSRFLHLMDSSLATLPAEVLDVPHAAVMLTCSVSQAPAAAPSFCNAFPQPLPAPGKTPPEFSKINIQPHFLSEASPKPQIPHI